MGNSSSSDDTAFQNRMAEEARAKAQVEAAKENRLAKEYEAAVKERINRENNEAKERAAKFAEEAKKQRAREKAEAQRKADIHEKEMQRMRDADEEKARKAKAEKEKKDREHKQKMKEMEAKRKAEEEKHREEMRQMIIRAKQQEVADKKQQKKDAITAMNQSVDTVTLQIATDQKEMEKKTESFQTKEKELKVLNDKIENWDPSNDDPEYAKWEKAMLAALEEYKRNDDEISKAIDRTGQTEDGVGRFLRLTHGLIGETMASQAHADTLDAELHTFSTLISRECQDKLTIEYFFKDQKLDRFVPILASQKYTECQELVCEDEDEFKEDILGLVEGEIDKEIEEWKKRHPNDIDPFDAFLDNYKLTKYKRALKELDIDSLDAVADEDLDDEAVEEIIAEAGIKGLAKKKFKRAVKEAQDGKYKPPEPAKNDDQDDTKGEEKDDEPKPLPISKKEKRLLKNICLKPSGWKEKEQEKSKLTKVALVQMSPVFGGFFMRMNQVVKQAQKLLDYSDKANQEQNEVIAAMMEPPKAIEAAKSNDDDSKAPDEPQGTEEKQDADEAIPDTSPEYAQRKGWKEASEVQVYSKEKNKWYNGKIKEITTDKEDEVLTVEYKIDDDVKTMKVNRFGKDVRDPLMVESRAIATAIAVDINVTEVMMPEFELTPTTLRVLPIARGVEQSAKAILLCQSQIRQSVKLAGAILSLKPANLKEESKKLWDAVDAGIIHILKGALEMNKISAVYFGYFLRFNQSFQRFVSMNKEDENVTLFTSLEHIKQDISEFSAFKKEFNDKVNQLSEEAMNVIKNCVEQHIGAQNFEETRKAREKSEQDYKQKLAKFNTEKNRVDKKLDEMRAQSAKDQGKVGALGIRIKQLEQRIKDNEKFKDDWIKEINDLQKDIIDTDGGFNDANKL